MSHPQSVMYEQEMSEIQEVTDKLHQDARARTILIIDKNGSLVASTGVEGNLDTTSLASLVAGNVAAIGGMAQLIKEEEFSGQFHEGKDISVHMTIVARRIILVILFDKNTTHGLVRLRVKKASEVLTEIFERLAEKAKNSPADNVFGGEITEEDIDNLFS
jgi:predicted regulator of Ras-like GTPase activity (Roadblock/LC7/MglB family)